MKTKGLPSSESAKQCSKLLEATSHSAIDAVYPINSGDMGYSSGFVFSNIYKQKGQLVQIQTNHFYIRQHSRAVELQMWRTCPDP